MNWRIKPNLKRDRGWAGVEKGDFLGYNGDERVLKRATSWGIISMLLSRPTTEPTLPQTSEWGRALSLLARWRTQDVISGGETVSPIR
jgi:hypothetical protein